MVSISFKMRTFTVTLEHLWLPFNFNFEILSNLVARFSQGVDQKITKKDKNTHKLRRVRKKKNLLYTKPETV